MKIREAVVYFTQYKCKVEKIEICSSLAITQHSLTSAFVSSYYLQILKMQECIIYTFISVICIVFSLLLKICRNVLDNREELERQQCLW